MPCFNYFVFQQFSQRYYGCIKSYRKSLHFRLTTFLSSYNTKILKIISLKNTDLFYFNIFDHFRGLENLFRRNCMEMTNLKLLFCYVPLVWSRDRLIVLAESAMEDFGRETVH